VKASAHGVSGKAAGRRGSGRGQAVAGARRHGRFAMLFDTDTYSDAEADPASDLSDPVLSDPVFGVGAAAWTDPETGLPPEAAILHVEED
jgi:hypothetical protein